MKLYIKSTTDAQSRHYNYYLLDFLHKLGIDNNKLGKYIDGRGNLKNEGFYIISKDPDVWLWYFLYGNSLTEDTIKVAICVNYEWNQGDTHEKELCQQIGSDYINNLIDVASTCDYIEDVSPIYDHEYKTMPRGKYRVDIDIRKPDNVINRRSNRLDNYVAKYGINFVFMVGKLFNKYLDANISEEPYNTKIQESGCSIDELKDIAKYLHNSVLLSVTETGSTYYLKPRSSSHKLGSANTYELNYADYERWLRNE